MGSFRLFLEEQEFVEFVQTQFAGVAPAHDPSKVWSATKDEIMQIWKNIRSDLPIYITPMTKTAGQNQSYGEDGIRITGSWNFISAVLGRLKELIAYENPQTKLRLVFRGVDKTHARPDKQAFVFYLNLDARGRGKAGRPSIKKAGSNG